jgi:hypothetical protein
MGTVIEVIAHRRLAAEYAQYQEDLKQYERALRRGKKTEIEMPEEMYWNERVRVVGWIGTAVEADLGKQFGSERKRPLGYQVTRRENGVTRVEFVKRPTPPTYGVWRYSGYERDYHAYQTGMLANPAVNREILPRRVESYVKQMRAGEWRDLLSDPITITDEGHVVNGQHRLAAISQVDWDDVENDPRFMVIFGVAAEEALLTDSSKRTGRDHTVIATKVLAGRDDDAIDKAA